jgi:hypothetical protein
MKLLDQSGLGHELLVPGQGNEIQAYPCLSFFASMNARLFNSAKMGRKKNKKESLIYQQKNSSKKKKKTKRN